MVARTGSWEPLPGLSAPLLILTFLHVRYTWMIRFIKQIERLYKDNIMLKIQNAILKWGGKVPVWEHYVHEHMLVHREQKHKHFIAQNFIPQHISPWMMSSLHQFQAVPLISYTGPANVHIALLPVCVCVCMFTAETLRGLWHGCELKMMGSALQIQLAENLTQALL